MGGKAGRLGDLFQQDLEEGEEAGRSVICADDVMAGFDVST